jgi:hypothetical protein
MLQDSRLGLMIVSVEGSVLEILGLVAWQYCGQGQHTQDLGFRFYL